MPYNINVELCKLLNLDTETKHNVDFIIDILLSNGIYKNYYYIYKDDLLKYIQKIFNLEYRNYFDINTLISCVYKSIISSPYDKYVCIDNSVKTITSLEIKL